MAWAAGVIQLPPARDDGRRTTDDPVAAAWPLAGERGSSPPAAVGQIRADAPSGRPDRGLAQEPVSEVLLHQLCDALAAIAGGEEPFGPLVIARAPAGPEGGRRDGERQRRVAEPDAAWGQGAAAEPDPAGWPAGPLINSRPLGGDQVAQIVTAALADLAAEGAGGLGREQLRESMRRLGLDGPTIGRVAPPLLVWLARAGVLAAPDDPAAPWAAPRPVVSADPEAVRVMLRVVEPPGPEEIAQERTRGLK